MSGEGASAAVGSAEGTFFSLGMAREIEAQDHKRKAEIQEANQDEMDMAGETEEAGLEVAGDAALRLKVGEWVSEWMCRETGVRANTGDRERDFKLVLAEPLADDSVGHVNK